MPGLFEVNGWHLDAAAASLGEEVQRPLEFVQSHFLTKVF